MGIGKPSDTVYKITSLQRWQREWINSHRAINYSGLVQQMLCDVIEHNDPAYFEMYKKDMRSPRRLDNLTVLKI